MSELRKDRSAKGLDIERVSFAGNTSGLEALDFMVIVRKDVVKETYGDSGLVISQGVRDIERWTVKSGVILSIGSNAFTNDGGVPWAVRPEVGDRVLFKEHSGQIIRGTDGEAYHLLTDKEIGCMEKKA